MPSASIGRATGCLWLIMFGVACLGLTPGCSPRGPARRDSITEEEFVSLYSRLLQQREDQWAGQSGGPAAGDTLTTDEQERLARFVQEASFEPKEWEDLLVRARDRVRVPSPGARGPSAGARSAPSPTSPGSGPRPAP